MSHFSTVKTQLRKKEPLLQALLDLGYVPQEKETLVRGFRGQTVKADLSVQMTKGGDLGFRWNPSTESYELVTDLDLWKQSVPVERFLAKLTQRYALNTVLTASIKVFLPVSSPSMAKIRAKFILALGFVVLE